MAIHNDIKENAIRALDKNLLKILLCDKTTKNNIIWATDIYDYRGVGYQYNDEITIEAITGYKGNVIKPRVEKSKKEQDERVRKKAEVFTPAWVCNAQNNLIDSIWFGRDNVFNIEFDNCWKTLKDKIAFPETEDKTWKDYVRARRLEVSCGEAPYLVSRYDSVTGESIPVEDRIGLLDRKLRIVSENTNSEEEWICWATKSVQSIYGFEWQGDNVLLARENILYSFVEHYEAMFKKLPQKSDLLKISKIIAWNIWQMDGIKFVVPNSCKKEVDTQISLFEETTVLECQGCEKNDNSKHNGIYCRTYDWVSNRSVEYYSLVKGGMRNGKI